MGSGIAQVSAQSGYRTIQFDLSGEMIEKSSKGIDMSLSKLVERGKMSAEEKQAILDRILFTTRAEDCVADMIIEAIIEKKEAKVDLFTQLAALNSIDTILATNTSSIPVSEIAVAVPHPERVVGIHFFNPAPLMKLVEVIQGHATSSEVMQQTINISKEMGKVPVVCKDAPGFIVNRIARPYYIEALRLVEEGIADYSTIDTLMQSCGFKMGPFRLMDLIGNDVNYAVSCSVYEQLGKPERLKPSPIQKEKVAAGKLGRKTGEGYYIYQ